MKNILLSTAMVVCVAGPSLAADAALIVGNSDYQSLRDVRGASDVVSSADEFQDLGFDVIARADATSQDIAAALGQFVSSSANSERVLVVLAGRFMRSSLDTWLLPVDASRISSLSALPRDALPLSTVLAVLGAHPGKAILLIADDGEDGNANGAYLTRGVGEFSVPQGVTVFRGSARAIAGFAEDVLPLPAMTKTVQAARQQGLSARGYLPANYEFLAGISVDTATEFLPVVDATAWEQARRLDTIASYEDYLAAFPEGDQVQLATALIQEIKTEPNRAQRLQEESLGLARDQRREVQRHLSILDFNPRGIDGIFGPGSRGAISRWQSENRFDATGYLTRDQIGRLEGQAARRAIELEAEAERRRLEQEQQDRSYWQATGSAGDEPGLRAYLKRYPDGVFAEIAQERLNVFEDQKRAKAAAQDRAAWDQVSAVGTVPAYRDYLVAFPQGAFAEEAQSKIDELTAEEGNSRELASAQRAEERLGLNKKTRNLIESRLNALGLKPGPIDGTFDDKTRRAIRRYQNARDMPVTGYLNQETVVRLLADSILR